MIDPDGSDEQTVSLVNTGMVAVDLTDLDLPGAPFTLTSFTIVDAGTGPTPPQDLATFQAALIAGPLVFDVGDSLKIVVTFDTNGEEEVLFTESFSITTSDNDNTIISIDLCGSTLEATAHLAVGDVVGAPGGTAVVPVVLNASVAVAGIQFDIGPVFLVGEGEATIDVGPEIAEIAGPVNAVEPLDFDVSVDTDEEGITTVLVFSLDGSTIPPGEISVLNLVYEVNIEVDVDITVDLVVSDLVIGDTAEQEVPSTADDGTILTGTLGDIAGSGDGGDGIVNIVDLVKEIRYILPLPHPDEFDEPEDEEEEAYQDRAAFQFYLADINGDNTVDVLDLISMINRILGNEGPPPLKTTEYHPVTIQLAQAIRTDDGQLTVPIRPESRQSVAGAQFSISFDPALLIIGAPYVVGRSELMTVESSQNSGLLSVLMYGPKGERVPAGNDVVLMIPVRAVDLKQEPTVTMIDAIVAGDSAQRLAVDLDGHTVRVASLPSTFTLEGNVPNPFNPATSISYDVPQQAHMVLTVYNLLG